MQTRCYLHSQTLIGVHPVQCDLKVQSAVVSSSRSLSINCVLKDWEKEKRESIDFSQDPEVKELLREMQNDFSKRVALTEYNDNEIKNENDLCGDVQKNADDGGMEERESSVKTVSSSEMTEKSKSAENTWAQYIHQKYEKFDAHSSEIIYDYDEERLRREDGIVKEEVKEIEITLQRGETGVFDIHELVDLLRQENAQDIVVMQIPPRLNYIAYIVIVSSNSNRHISALAEFVRRIYKRKKHQKDPSVIIEGKKTNWIAMDLGNIALHMMRQELRESYDLETLWTVGPEYDDKCREREDSMNDMYNFSDPLAGFTAPSISPQSA